MADQLTHQIVGLIEHAELCQQAASEGQKALDAGARALTKATDGLDERIKKAVAAAVTDNLANIPAELEKAVADALVKPIEALGTASEDVAEVTSVLKWKVAIGVAFIAFVAMLAPVAVWALLVPSNTEIQQLRAERDQLNQETSYLRNYKAVTKCGPQSLPCASVDFKGQAFTGSHGEIYFLLKH